MKTAFKLCLAIFVFCMTCVATLPAEPNRDAAVEQELERFSDLLAAQLRKAGVKKIAVLDLVDTEKKNVRLGAFIAEETTVNLVSSTNTFIVVDRANLDKILDEHKLSRSGLESPENAKKLGQLSGVDAIVIGTITPLQNEIRFTAKVISTQTADILGAAKGKIPKDVEVIKMTERESAIQTNSVTLPPPIVIPKNSKQIDDLLLTVESLNLTGDQYTGNLLATVVFRNMSPTKTIGVGMYSRSNVKMESTIRNDVGDEFVLFFSEMSGIKWAPSEQYLTAIKPGESLDTTLKYYIRWNNKNGDYGPYRFQAEILVGEGERGRYTNVKTQNFLITIPSAK